MSLLTILIPSIIERQQRLDRLLSIITPQCNDYGVQILIDQDNREKSIGAKRNDLVARVTTPYCVFIDDDDEVSLSYVEKIYEGLDKGVDGIGFKGMMTIDGKNAQEFIHSKQYSYTSVKSGVTKQHYRPLNHLNPMRTEFFAVIPFPEINHGEDTTFCLKLQELDLIQTEHFIDEHLYFYKYLSTKH